MLGRSLLVWVLILICAVLNGMLRDLVLSPRLGDTVGRAISSILLSAVVLIVTALTLRWMKPTGIKDAFSIGALWLVMTLGFEFVAGHYLFKKSWAVLLEDYNIAQGKIWLLVLITTLLAPVLMIWLSAHTSRR
jgi:hypothetical protein